jgi:hypothetical protein
MRPSPPHGDQHPAAPLPDNAIAVVSAYGAFRLLLVLLAVWSFFAGFSLLTQGLGQLSFGGQDTAAERVIGAHMIVLAPVYALIAWRRSEYRLFMWIPYAAQLAIIVPALWEFVFGGPNDDGALLLIVSIIFLVLLVYVWSSSHPLGFFAPHDGDDEQDGDELDDVEDPDEADDAPAAGDTSARGRRYRRSD